MISKYAVPDRVYFVDAIPKTSVGKLDKKVIRAKLAEQPRLRPPQVLTPSRTRRHTMSQYRAPLAEMQFVMTELAGLDEIAALPGYEDATPDTVAAILEEAGKFAADVLDPLNARRRPRGRAPGATTAA